MFMFGLLMNIKFLNDDLLFSLNIGLSFLTINNSERAEYQISSILFLLFSSFSPPIDAHIKNDTSTDT